MIYFGMPQKLDSERPLTCEGLIMALHSKYAPQRWNALEFLGRVDQLPARYEGTIYLQATARALDIRAPQPRQVVHFRHRSRNVYKAACPTCGDTRNQKRRGFTGAGVQRYECKACKRSYSNNL